MSIPANSANLNPLSGFERPLPDGWKERKGKEGRKKEKERGGKKGENTLLHTVCSDVCKRRDNETRPLCA